MIDQDDGRRVGLGQGTPQPVVPLELAIVLNQRTRPDGFARVVQRHDIAAFKKCVDPIGVHDRRRRTATDVIGDLGRLGSWKLLLPGNVS